MHIVKNKREKIHLDRFAKQDIQLLATYTGLKFEIHRLIINSL